MNTTAEEIRHRMKEVRHDIDGNVGDLVDSAKSLVDWRDYVKNYPLISMGLACAVGAVLVPSKKQPPIKADASDVSNLLKNQKLTVAPNAKVKQQPTIATTLIATVAGTLLRAAVGYAGEQASAAFRANSDNSKQT